jgi:tetratricopeptide (TPR) repeat protein
MFYQTGAVASQTNWLHDLAEAYCAAGQVEDGLAVIAKAEQVEQDTGEARHKSALERIKGDLYRLKGDDTAAEKAYRRAIAVARADGTKLLELEAVMRLACLWREQGKEKHGLEMLRAVYDWFTEGFNAPMLVEAKALMEDLAS